MFDEENMNIVAEKLFEAESNAAGGTAYTAGNINKQRMICIHSDVFFCKLLLDALCGNGIAKEQCYRVFIVYKITGGKTEADRTERDSGAGSAGKS